MFIKCIEINFAKRFIQPYIQWIAVFGVFMLMIQIGLIHGWIAPNLAKLTSNNSFNVIPILDDDQVSWIGSLSALGGFIGAIVGSLFIELFGSRLGILLTFIIVTISWACVVIANSVIWLYAARIFGGLAGACTYCSFTIYLGEIADPKIRGTLVSIATCGNPIGNMMSTIMETYLTMRATSTFYLTLSIMAIILFLWLPDSPYYLIRKKNNYELAKESIKFYHHDKKDVEKELKEIASFVEAHSNNGQSLKSKLADLKSPSIRISIIFVIVTFLLPNLSGYGIMSSYIDIISKKSKSHLIKSEDFVVYANVLSVVSNVLTFKLIDVLGRRILLIISSVGTTIALVGLGIHFLLLKNETFYWENLQLLPIIFILGYFIVYSIGYGTVPGTLLGEIVADNVKAIAAFSAIACVSLVNFFILKIYLKLVESIGETIVFWILGTFSFMAVPFAIFLLPETKGKTFQQIQDDLIKK